MLQNENNFGNRAFRVFKIVYREVLSTIGKLADWNWTEFSLIKQLYAGDFITFASAPLL